MGYVLPGWMDEILDFIGINWPNVDEDDYREMADAMREFADNFEGHGAQAHQTVSRILASSEGWAVDSLQEYWGKVKEQYLHEWRMRFDSGRCVTVQLVSNVPLSAKEALAVRDGLRTAPTGARVLGPGGHRQPTATPPTAGQPTGRPAYRQPRKDLGENTSPPTTPAPPQAEHRDDGERLLRSLSYGDRRLAMSARTAQRWAPLAGAWLDSGMPRDRIRRLLTDGLGDTRNPLGVLHWRLEHALPDAVAAPAASEPQAEPPTPRLRGMRECRTEHVQPRLFAPRPGHDDDRCPDCRDQRRAATGPTPPPSEGSGYAEFLAAREAACTRPAVRVGRVTATRARELDPQASCEGEAEE